MEGATDAVEDTAAAADEAMEDSTATQTDEAMISEDSEVLTVDGFDFDRVMEMVESSELSQMQKTVLTTSLEGARDNPELLQPVLENIKELMGM